MKALKSCSRPDWLPQSAWPWEIRSQPTLDGRVAVTEAGQGPVLLMLHVGAWGFIWRDLVRLLSPDFRCIVIDGPGSGLSDRLEPGKVTLEAAAIAIGAVIDDLNLREVTLVLHDLGGPAGIAAAASRTDRVAAIAAVNTFAWRPHGAAFRGMLRIMGSRPVSATDEALGWLPRATSTRFGVGRSWSMEDRQVFRAGLDSDARSAWHRYFADALAADRLYDKTESALTGPLADRPLLTVFGERNDPLGFQPRWKALFPGSRQKVVPNGNHFPMCDAPGLVAEIIRAWHSEAVASVRNIGLSEIGGI